MSKSMDKPICTCKYCNLPFSPTDPHELESNRLHPENVSCPACIHIEMARRYAVQNSISLRDAVDRYLAGMEKKTGKPRDKIWRAL